MKNFNKVIIQQAEEVGSHFTEYLVEQGHKVKAFVRYNSRNFWGWLENQNK